MKALPCAVTVLLVFSAPGWADFESERLDNWHHWRGPQATGVAPKADPPITWDARKNIKWKAPLPGRGSATPIIWKNQVFVVTAVPTERAITAAQAPRGDPRLEKKTTAPLNYYQFLVLCLDRRTGKELWRQLAHEAVPHEGHHPSHSYAAGSPTTDGQRLYVSFGSFGIYCYDLNGKLLWERRDLGQLKTRYGWGEAVTPVIHREALLLNWDQEVDSSLLCLETRTGKTRWQAQRDERTSWNTPLVVEQQGRTQVILNGTKRIRSHALESGKVLWECGGMSINAIPSPVADDDFVYVLSGYQKAAGVAIPLTARGDLTQSDQVLWRLNRGTPYVPSALLLNGRLWFTQGNNPFLSLVEARTGKLLLERERLPGQSNFYASPAAAAGRIYLVDRNGTTLVLREGSKLEVLATNVLDDGIDASPALVGRQIFLRSNGWVYCIEQE